MNPLLDRLAAISPAPLVGVSGALAVAVLVGAWIVSAVTGHRQGEALGAAAVAAVIAAIGLLYAFRLGTPSASQ
jgi:apolipoprotein N-acyltransferase